VVEGRGRTGRPRGFGIAGGGARVGIGDSLGGTARCLPLPGGAAGEWFRKPRKLLSYSFSSVSIRAATAVGALLSYTFLAADRAA